MVLSSAIIPTEGIPWNEQDAGGFLPAWGAYDGLAADPVNQKFVAAWGDSRWGLDPYVVSARFSP